jgi:hypothetical protein
MKGYTFTNIQLTAIVEEYFPEPTGRNLLLDLLLAQHNLQYAIDLKEGKFGITEAEIASAYENGKVDARYLVHATWLTGVGLEQLKLQHSSLHGLAVIQSFLWALITTCAKERGIPMDLNDPLSLTSRQALALLIEGAPEKDSFASLIKSAEKLKGRAMATLPPGDAYCKSLADPEHGFRGIYEMLNAPEFGVC